MRSTSSGMQKNQMKGTTKLHKKSPTMTCSVKYVGTTAESQSAECVDGSYVWRVSKGSAPQQDDYCYAIIGKAQNQIQMAIAKRITPGSSPR